MIKKVYTSAAPEAIGPYSQAIICGNMLFTSGQIPINPATGDIDAEDIDGQTTQVMKNIAAVLAEAGTSFEKVVKNGCQSVFLCFVFCKCPWHCFIDVFVAAFEECKDFCHSICYS